MHVVSSQDDENRSQTGMKISLMNISIYPDFKNCLYMDFHTGMTFHLSALDMDKIILRQDHVNSNSKMTRCGDFSFIPGRKSHRDEKPHVKRPLKELYTADQKHCGKACMHR